MVFYNCQYCTSYLYVVVFSKSYLQDCAISIFVQKDHNDFDWNHCYYHKEKSSNLFHKIYLFLLLFVFFNTRKITLKAVTRFQGSIEWLVIILLMLNHPRCLRMIFRSSRLAVGRLLSFPKDLLSCRWYFSDINAEQRSHKCSADSFFSPHSRHWSSSHCPVRGCHLQRAGWCQERKRMRSFFDISAFFIGLGFEIVRNERRRCWKGGVASSADEFCCCKSRCFYGQ